MVGGQVSARAAGREAAAHDEKFGGMSTNPPTKKNFGRGDWGSGAWLALREEEGHRDSLVSNIVPAQSVCV